MRALSLCPLSHLHTLAVVRSSKKERKVGSRQRHLRVGTPEVQRAIAPLSLFLSPRVYNTDPPCALICIYLDTYSVGILLASSFRKPVVRAWGCKYVETTWWRRTPDAQAIYSAETALRTRAYIDAFARIRLVTRERETSGDFSEIWLSAASDLSADVEFTSLKSRAPFAYCFFQMRAVRTLVWVLDNRSARDCLILVLI